MDEQHIHQRIGQILYNSGPVDAQKIIARAELFAENDGGKYEFDYINRAGEIGWFDPDGRAIGELTDALLELRNHHINNGLCPQASPWSRATIELDISSMKLAINMSYEHQLDIDT